MSANCRPPLTRPTSRLTRTSFPSLKRRVCAAMANNGHAAAFAPTRRLEFSRADATAKWSSPATARRVCSLPPSPRLPPASRCLLSAACVPVPARPNLPAATTCRRLQDPLAVSPADKPAVNPAKADPVGLADRVKGHPPNRSRLLKSDWSGRGLIRARSSLLSFGLGRTLYRACRPLASGRSPTKARALPDPDNGNRTRFRCCARWWY